MPLISGEKTEACICAHGGHFKHLLWRCLPDIQVVTQQNTTGSFHCHQCHTTQLTFSDSPRFGGKQCTFHKMNEFCISQGSAVRWASSKSWLQFVLFWDNVNNEKYIWIILLNFTTLPWEIQKVTFRQYYWKVTFGFPEVKWLQHRGEVGKSVKCWCKIFSASHVPNVITIVFDKMM